MYGAVPLGSGPGEFDAQKFASEKHLRDKSLASVFALHVAEEAVTRSGWKPVNETEQERTGLQYLVTNI